MTIIKQIESWFKAAVPEPTDDNRRVQLGCHLEEVSEMTDCLQLTTESVSSFEVDMKDSELSNALNRYSHIFKNGRDRSSTVRYENIIILDKTA
ncbi:hypothetical protein, partial [Commensalibacter intestini]|uniref:hypothetical protein n=1 Tax=Commensalibacter intestini TaxID=479936 RepID=UPI00058C9CF2